MKKILILAVAAIVSFAIAQTTAKLEVFKAVPLPLTVMPDPIPTGMIGPGAYPTMREVTSACSPSIDGLQVPVDVTGVQADSAISKQIQDIVDADQAARQIEDFSKVDWAQLEQDDTQRRRALLPLIPKAVSATDFANIALVFQHGDCIPQYMLANHFARLGASGSELARWLVAATLDRALMNNGRAQKYGTQYTSIGLMPCFALYVVDPRTTDEERIALGVPILSEAIAKAKTFSDPSCK